MADYNILFQGQNPGAAFANAFQQAQQQRQQNALLQQQMQEHAQDRQLKMQQDQSAALQQQIEAHRENIVKGAQIIRQLKPTDDASWQHALAIAQQAGIDISEVPQHFDPQYVQGISAIADTFGPQPAQDPSSVREYEYAKQNGFTGSYVDFQQYLHPPSALTIPYNSTVTTQGGRGEVTATGPSGQKLRLNPQTNQWEPMGGAGGNASGGFPPY